MVEVGVETGLLVEGGIELFCLGDEQLSNLFKRAINSF